MKKILIVSKCPTHPTIKGNRQWILNQCELLRRIGCDVYFLFVVDRPIKTEIELYDDAVEKTKSYWGDRYFEYNVGLFDKIKCLIKKYWNIKFNNMHIGCDDEYPMGLSKYVILLDKKIGFDACFVNYYYLTKLFNSINIPIKALSTHDCFAYKDIKFGKPTICLTPNEESKALQRCPIILALQDNEGLFFKMLSPKSQVFNVYATYNNFATPITSNHNILFFSGDNEFNISGILWFINYIWPIILKEHEDAKLIIGGGICRKLENKIISKSILYKGRYDNPIDFYRLGDVVINPVFQGTGLKIKTFEALSYGKVVLAHPHSVDGIYIKDKAPLFTSEVPTEWSSYLSKIWSDNNMILEIKHRDADNILQMNSYITETYKNILNIE